MRGFLIIVVVLLAILVGGFIFLFMNAGSLIEGLIETVGTETTGTSVEVGSVEFDLGAGSAGIFNFTIDNPDGFSNANAFSLDEISIVLDAENSTRELLVLSEVVVASPQVLYEIADEGGSNIDALRANIEEHQGSMGSGGGSSSSGSDTKMIIDRLRFTGGTVVATARGEQVEVDLPPLTLTNIGRASGGETASEIAAQVADQLTQHVMQTVARSEIERQLGVDGVLDGVRDIFGR